MVFLLENMAAIPKNNECMKNSNSTMLHKRAWLDKEADGTGIHIRWNFANIFIDIYHNRDFSAIYSFYMVTGTSFSRAKIY